VTPLDLVKCNAQTNAKDFPNVFAGFRNIFQGKLKHLGFGSGFSGVVKGWGPTLMGYSAQGLGKFGFYEVFKHLYKKPFTEEQCERFSSLLYGASSASAEFFADIALCPFEAVKVRVQTSPGFAKGLMDGMPKMIAEGGVGGLYAGLVPLWARQIPYTVIKFVAFERIAEMVYAQCSKPKSEMNQVEQMGVVFTSGYLAGILCGAVSHPADTLVSKINTVKSAGGIGDKIKLIYSGTKEVPGIGFKGLWAGFLPRVVMIGTLTGLQWFIYGAFKGAVGLPTPGKAAKSPAKKEETSSSSSN
jgi:solute carrier family 25 phosphate transporter 3